MKLSKTFKLAFNMLLHSKVRSWLTILGIFIGVAAVVAIISLGQGLQQNVNSRISGFGQDLITISAGSSRASGFGEGGGGRTITNAKQLSDNDIQVLKLIPGIKSINGVVSGRADLKYQSETTTSSIQGYDLSVFGDFVNTSIESGRYLNQGDVKSILIGDSLANNVFKTKLNVGYIITINDKPFRIVGILSKSTGFGGGDNSIYMSNKDAREVLSNTSTLKQNEYSSIIVKVADAQDVQTVSDNIQSSLRNSHHVAAGKEDFSVSSPTALQARLSSVTSGITLFLLVIAAVSLLVGGIGVANTMFTSVLEKTRDIGTMKSIGAKNSDILLIFLLNSGMLGLVGGIFGIIFAFGISLIIPYVGLRLGAGSGDFTMPIHLGLILFAVLFSTVLGMLFGAIPAYRASKLNPVDALRHD